MSKRSWESAVGDEYTALSNIGYYRNVSCRDASSGGGRASPAATSSRKMEQQEEYYAITAAVPANIVGDVLKRMNPREAVRLSSVCRYWRPPALACNPTLRPTPWMVEVTLTWSENRLHFRLQSAVDASVFVKLNPVYFSPKSTIWCLEDSWHGWLLCSLGMPKEKFLLLNPFSGVRIDLPPYNNLRDVLCITSDPTAPGCAVIARDFFYNLIVCRPGDGSWTVGAEIRSIDTPMIHTVWLKEQLFMLDHLEKRLLTLQLFPLRCKDAVPVRFCEDLSLWNFLVESQGDLLLFDVNPTDFYVEKSCLWIRAFRLDWDTMAFKPAESLGSDRAVLLGNFGESISVSAVETGCTADCIYIRNFGGFISGERFSWLCYNLKKRTVQSVVPWMPRFPKIMRQLWITPPVKNNCSQEQMNSGCSFVAE